MPLDLVRLQSCNNCPELGEIGPQMDRKSHWEQVYSTRMAEKLGWYKPRLETSLSWLGEIGLDKASPIIDIGGGASTFVDDLVDDGYESITVLDVSDQALETSKSRLGRQSQLVMWLSGDITSYALPPDRFALWHDRAMLHFLTDSEQRNAYRNNLLQSLQPGGYVIVGVFAPEAPEKCSGLPVQRYDAVGLAEFLGDKFELVHHDKELHVTPGGVEQMYVYCLFRRSEAH